MTIPSHNFTPGNTLTVSVAIYKQNWHQYLKLSVIAHLWLLVPVYGWAKYFAIAAWISKLSFPIYLLAFISIFAISFIMYAGIFDFQRNPIFLCFINFFLSIKISL